MILPYNQFFKKTRFCLNGNLMRRCPQLKKILKQSVNYGAMQDKHARDEAMPKEIRRDPTPAEKLKRSVLQYFPLNHDVIQQFQRPGVNDPQRQPVLSPRTEALQNIWMVFEDYKRLILPLNRKADIRLGVASSENIAYEDAYLGAMQDVVRAMLNGADFESLCGEQPPQEDTEMAANTQKGRVVLPQIPLPYKEMLFMYKKMVPPDKGRCTDIMATLVSAVINLGRSGGDVEMIRNHLEQQKDAMEKIDAAAKAAFGRPPSGP
ncbi:MAG TPA: hypothetical protein VIF12_03815 [Micavibrio sp.]